MTKNSTIQTLRSKIRETKAVPLIVAKTKEKKMNRGKGYSYGHIRKVLLYGSYQNSKIIDVAIEVLETIQQQKELREADLAARVMALS